MSRYRTAVSADLLAMLLAVVQPATTTMAAPAAAASVLVDGGPNLTEVEPEAGVTGVPCEPGQVCTDLRLTYGWGIYLNVTGAEAKAVASALMAAGGLSYVYTCDKLGQLPSYAGVVARLICTLVGVPTAKAILNSVASLWRNGASTYTCYQKRILPSVSGWNAVRMSNCTG